MKKLLLVIAVLSEALFAISPKTMEIVFKSLKIDDSKIKEDLCDSIYSGLPKAETSRYRALCVSVYDIIEYNSPIDYSVLFTYESGGFTLRRQNQTCKNPILSDDAEGTPGTAQFSEVLFAELMRLQKYGVIQNDRDSLETFLFGEIAKMKEASFCEDIDLVVYDEEFGAKRPDMGEQGCCSLVKSPSALPVQVRFPSYIRVSKIIENRFFLSNAKIGSNFALFDMNGKVLKQGVVLSKIIQAPMLPAVLKIQNQIMMLK
ncbi:hypothetical protein [Fibrobacter succinogenes]|uniref:hypothetical protein n=1 Tax=Fibrobacter succinogenes TaxID=833 RepID=UPI0015687312|nr:hypothetical protein [Fibrobacter succinogenes]